MPRANRYIQPGCLYHLTHRCHDRQFLFRFAKDRREYRNRLRTSLAGSAVSLLAYCITSNHTHLLVEAGSTDGISRMMQKLEGEFAEWYNWRKHRSGAFWEDRFHCTMIEGNPHLWNCMVYIDLNMVRAGVVQHPEEWRWCGFDELTGRRQRYRLLDFDCVLKWNDGMRHHEFAGLYELAIAEALERRRLQRNPIWTESIAVGSKAFISTVAQRLLNRRRLEETEVDGGAWIVRESPIPYGDALPTTEEAKTPSRLD